ncbi:zf-u1-domain-containing protein [Ceraceosorus bombacis]|uniref:U1 small nuclear ribonucleoprotein C n=1 Tax=Ceraceosorus bombacis TaxID=401625 RepID=A0A0P1B9Z4_9BASI|nr:zf-u1-domain-containing protein [Ceraceosorus bombacis]
MGKHYCDYCDVYLTHDSTSVRKAHNSGRNHMQNVRDYYQGLDPAKVQGILADVTRAYEEVGLTRPTEAMGYRPPFRPPMGPGGPNGYGPPGGGYGYRPPGGPGPGGPGPSGGQFGPPPGYGRPPPGMGMGVGGPSGGPPPMGMHGQGPPSGPPPLGMARPPPNFGPPPGFGR